MVTDDTFTSIMDPTKTLRTVRSHRAKLAFTVGRPATGIAKPFVFLLILVVAAPFLVTSVIPDNAPTNPLSTPETAQTYAPLTFPTPPYAEPSTVRTEGATRASRDAATTEKTQPPAQVQVQPSKVEIVISFAMAQVGKRYVFGTKGPNTYDCSGLVLRAYAQVGIALYHYTGEMLKRGKVIDRSNLQRGDLVFPSTGHVQLYLGNGNIVHASSGKGAVTVAKLSGFYTARRIL